MIRTSRWLVLYCIRSPPYLVGVLTVPCRVQDNVDKASPGRHGMAMYRSSVTSTGSTASVVNDITTVDLVGPTIHYLTLCPGDIMSLPQSASMAHLVAFPIKEISSLSGGQKPCEKTLLAQRQPVSGSVTTNCLPGQPDIPAVLRVWSPKQSSCATLFPFLLCRMKAR